MGFSDDIRLKIHDVIYKGIKHVGTMAAGVLSGLAVKYFHIPIAEDHQLAIAMAVAGALGSLLNVIKQKFPDKLGWL